MTFSSKQINRYSRQIILKKVGIVGQKKLLNSKVLIVGAGGLGSPVSMYLSASGIGTIGIIDHDNVVTSNLQRQILFNSKDIKKSKSIIAAKKLKQINPNIKIVNFKNKIKKNNIDQIAKNFDIVADGTNEMAIRLERVLNNAPGMGILRHSDAGYDHAITISKKWNINIPLIK